MTTATQILSLVFASLNQLGLTPYIDAALIVAIAIGTIAMVYAKFNKS
jgi:hypothetical protein